MADSAKEVLDRLLAVMEADRGRLETIDKYIRGDHPDPYMPENASDEYRALAKRAISNWMPLLVATPAQALYVDGFRRGAEASESGRLPGTAPEWRYWQRSRMDARQSAVYRAAFGYGHAFVLTERGKDGSIQFRGLSPRRTAALYEDPANDEDPYAVFTVDHPRKGDKKGRGRLWIGGELALVDITEDGYRIGEFVPTGTSTCPVTRFAASVDLDGRTTGVVEPAMVLQDRINQSTFDLLVVQTFGSFKVRTVAGMAPPMKRGPDGNILTDEDGQPIPDAMPMNPSRWQFSEDPDTKFGVLDGTPLEGYIQSIDMSIRHLAAVTQTPPHYLLGQIANLSAEALQSAEASLHRKVEEFRKAFGECWERCFRLAAELDGNAVDAENYSGQVIWRDMEQHSLSQAADALGKLGDQLGIPKRGLWPRVPNVTQEELDDWADLADEDPTNALGTSMRKVFGRQQAVDPEAEVIA